MMIFSWLSRPILARKPTGANKSVESALHNAVSIARQNDLLAKVIKESMTHMGAVSSSYRFKCLSQDAQATSFIVLIDLPNGTKVDQKKLGDIEVILRRSAHSRYEIRVKSIYWRFDQSQPVPTVITPAGAPMKSIDLSGLIEPIPVSDSPNALAANDDQPTRIADYEPATSDELAALNRQFSDSCKGPARPWRDTEVLEGEDEIAVLGATQYAKLN